MAKKETLKKVAFVALLMLGVWIVQQIAGLIFFTVLVSFPASDMITVLPSADGRYTAYIYSQSYFQVRDESYNLTVLPSWVPVPFERLIGITKGNTLCVYRCAFTAQWMQDGTLQVTLDTEGLDISDIRKQEDTFCDVRIHYLYA